MRRPCAFLSKSVTTLSVLTLLISSPSLARAQGAGANAPAASKDQAKKLFEEGADLEKKGDFAGALAKYKEAEQLAVTPGLRFHEGYCLEMIGKLTAALEAYDAADKLAREQNRQDVHAAVAVRLDPLRARVPNIAIRLSTPTSGVDVQVDGVAVVPARLEGKGFPIDPGEHTLTARAVGYKSLTRKLQTPESVTTTVDVSLERATMASAAPVAPVEPTAPAATTEPPGEVRRGPSRALPIATTAGAFVLAGAGVAFFLVAAGAQSDAHESCPAKPICDDEQSRVRTFDALALGSFIGAAGLGVLSVVLWTSKGPTPSAARGLPGSASAARTRVIATPRTFAVEGTF